MSEVGFCLSGVVGSTNIDHRQLVLAQDSTWCDIVLRGLKPRLDKTAAESLYILLEVLNDKQMPAHILS